MTTITDKQIEELEGVLTSYKDRPTYDWTTDDINQCLDALPALLSEVKAARSQRAAVDWATEAAGEVKAAGPQKTRPLADFIAEQREQRAAVVEMEARKDAAYLERNQVVAALASVFPSGIARTAIPGWSDDWHQCVYIDLPTGQCAWHYHDSHAHLFAHLPPYARQWDGHTTEQKYERVALLSSAPPQERVASPSSSDLVKALEESTQDAIYSAYLGICVLNTMCRKAGLHLGEQRTKELLVELGTAFPFIAERVGRSALRSRREKSK